MSGRSWNHNQAGNDRAALDLYPACPRCGDVCDIAAWVCPACGCKLHAAPESRAWETVSRLSVDLRGTVAS